MSLRCERSEPFCVLQKYKQEEFRKEKDEEKGNEAVRKFLEEEKEPENYQEAPTPTQPFSTQPVKPQQQQAQTAAQDVAMPPAGKRGAGAPGSASREDFVRPEEAGERKVRQRIATVEDEESKEEYPSMQEPEEETADELTIAGDFDLKGLTRAANKFGVEVREIMTGLEIEIARLLKEKMFELTTVDQFPDAQEVNAILAIRRNSDGSLRARIVMQDFSDHHSSPEFFSPTPSQLAFRVLLLIAQRERKQVRIGDFESAFMQVEWEGPIVLVKPPRVLHLPTPEHRWRLLKAWAGMRRSPKLFSKKLFKVLTNLNFKRIPMDPQVYCNAATDVFISTHVDDFAMVGDEQSLDLLEQSLQQQLKIKPNSVKTFGRQSVVYLGKEYIRSHDGLIKMRVQENYYTEMLRAMGLEQCRTINTPALAGLKPNTEEERHEWDKPVAAQIHSLYRMVAGKLRFVLDHRTDLLFAGLTLSRELATGQSICKLKRFLRYLRGTSKVWLRLEHQPGPLNEPLRVVSSVDSDWAGDKQSRKSSTCVITRCEGIVLHQIATTQTTIALSSGESELYAIAAGAGIALFRFPYSFTSGSSFFFCATGTG